MDYRVEPMVLYAGKRRILPFDGEKEWSQNSIELFLGSELRTVELNGKIAFSQAGYVLARTEEVETDIRTLVGRIEGTSPMVDKPMFCEVDSFSLCTNFLSMQNTIYVV